MRRSSATWIAGGVALWIVVVVVGAGRRPDATTWIGTTGVDAVVILTACAGLLVVLAYLLSGRYRWEAPERSLRNPWAQIVPLLLILLAVVVWNRVASDSGLPDLEESVEDILDAMMPEISTEPAEPAPPAVFELRDILLVATGLGAGLLGLWALAYLRRVGSDDAATGGEAEQYHAALRSARHRLGTSRDPRTAILLAYADLEAALAEIGQARGVADTVAEHQERVLREFRLDERPFHALAALYTRARFSSDSVTEQDRVAATVALDQSLGLIGVAS